MKQKNILILVIIAVIVVGAVWFFMIREPVDPDPVVPNDLVDPIVKEEIPVELELCRRAITIAQLREITNHEEYLTFIEGEISDILVPELGVRKYCGIILSKTDLPENMELKLEILQEGELPEKIKGVIGIEFFSLDLTYEKIKEAKMPWLELAVDFIPGIIIEREVEDVGKKAFSMRASAIIVPDGIPRVLIVFLDSGTNQTIKVMSRGKVFDYEMVVELAIQVEENLK